MKNNNIIYNKMICNIREDRQAYVGEGGWVEGIVFSKQHFPVCFLFYSILFLYKSENTFNLAYQPIMNSNKLETVFANTVLSPDEKMRMLQLQGFTREATDSQYLCLPGQKQSTLTGRKLLPRGSVNQENSHTSCLL